MKFVDKEHNLQWRKYSGLVLLPLCKVYVVLGHALGPFGGLSTEQLNCCLPAWKRREREENTVYWQLFDNALRLYSLVEMFLRKDVKCFSPLLFLLVSGSVIMVSDILDIDCVKVSRYDSQTRLVSNTNSSLRLHVSPWQPPSGCADTSFPSVKYTIHYRAVNAADSDVICTHPQAACSHQVK